MKTWTLRFRKVNRDAFEQIKAGTKKIETRAATVKYLPIKEGDALKFVCGNNSITKRVAKRYRWRSIDAVFREVPLKKVMPAVSDLDEARARYHSFPGYKEKIKEFGLLGFELE